MFYNTTFAPAFERERRYKMMRQTFRKKKFRNNLEVLNKSPYLCGHVRKSKATKEFFERLT